jgi:hypothetical protein
MRYFFASVFSNYLLDQINELLPNREYEWDTNIRTYKFVQNLQIIIVRHQQSQQAVIIAANQSKQTLVADKRNLILFNF